MATNDAGDYSHFPFSCIILYHKACMLWERVVPFQIGFRGNFPMHMLLFTYSSVRSRQVSSKSTCIHASKIDCFYMVDIVGYVVVVNNSQRKYFFVLSPLVVFHEWTLISTLILEYGVLVYVVRTIEPLLTTSL